MCAELCSRPSPRWVNLVWSALQLSYSEENKYFAHVTKSVRGVTVEVNFAFGLESQTGWC